MTFLDHRQLNHQNVNFNFLTFILINNNVFQYFKEKALACSFMFKYFGPVPSKVLGPQFV